MRILLTPLTYKTLKERALFHVHKKNFPPIKNALDFYEELEYIRVCLWEGIKIIGAYYKKKFLPGKNAL